MRGMAIPYQSFSPQYLLFLGPLMILLMTMSQGHSSKTADLVLVHLSTSGLSSDFFFAHYQPHGFTRTARNISPELKCFSFLLSISFFSLGFIFSHLCPAFCVLKWCQLSLCTSTAVWPCKDLAKETKALFPFLNLSSDTSPLDLPPTAVEKGEMNLTNPDPFHERLLYLLQEDAVLFKFSE